MIPVRLVYAGLVASFGAMKKPQSVGAWTIATFGGCSEHGAAAATLAVQTDPEVYGGRAAETSKRLTLVAAFALYILTSEVTQPVACFGDVLALGGVARAI